MADQQEGHGAYLRWASIKANVISNDFETARDMGRIDVHYRFLSSYVHPISDRHAATYGRNRSWPRYDHYSSELILLYVITFAVREVRSFMTMCTLEPRVAIVDEDGMRRDCDQLWESASHLWFPGHPKQPFDEFQAFNRIAYAKREEPPRDLDPDTLYYADPLSRIVALHRSTRELLSGAVYQSPWQRADAAWR